MIKVGLIGVGNCASALVQGVHYYSDPEALKEGVGLHHINLGGYVPGDITFTCAFDVDKRKVGKPLNEAILAPPNCTEVFCSRLPTGGVTVSMGTRLDGLSDHMLEADEALSFRSADLPDASIEEVVEVIKESGTELLVNFLPVGSEEATRFYAGCALEAGVAFINCIPVFIASSPDWAKRFKKKGLPVIGDDIKAQYGATAVHRALTQLATLRGVKVDRMYQLNTGGNTDFMNMLNRERLASKKTSKTEAVQAAMASPLDPENLHVGPSDYVPWQKDQKNCFIRMEGRIFGDVGIHMDVRLSVVDSPNSAGVVIDAIRCCKVALVAGIGGILEAPSASFMKHPPVQLSELEADERVRAFCDNPLNA